MQARPSTGAGWRNRIAVDDVSEDAKALADARRRRRRHDETVTYPDGRDSISSTRRTRGKIVEILKWTNCSRRPAQGSG
jgi:hypothetical protein